MEDYENKVAKLNPTIRWSDCEQDFCILPIGKSRVGRVTVPADYDHPGKGHLSLYFHQYLNDTTTQPQLHLILICGGPGAHGPSLNSQANAILKGLPGIPLAVYVFDHRGLGESGAFTPSTTNWRDLVPQLSSIVAKGPFPLNQLCIKNGALDVISLGLAIKNDPNNHPESTLHISGGSYGGYLGNYVVGLAPNLFHSAQLASSPALRGGPYSTAQGLALSCVLDDYCRNRIGPNVYERQRQAIRNIVQYDTNPCTQALGDRLSNFTSTDNKGRLQILSSAFDDLIGNQVKITTDDETFSGQVLLLALIATDDCSNPDNYKEEILKPLLSIARPIWIKDIEAEKGLLHSRDINQGKVKAIEDNFDKANASNPFMNSVLFIDMMLYDGDGQWMIPPDLDEIHDDIMVPFNYGHRYEKLKPYLKGQKFSTNRPLQTTKTQVFMETGLEDLLTTYNGALWNYKNIEAPYKTLSVFYGRGHSITHDDCFIVSMAALLGVDLKVSLEECMHITNKVEKRNWSLSGADSKWRNFWNHIKPPSKVESKEKQLMGLNGFQSQGTWKPLRTIPSFKFHGPSIPEKVSESPISKAIGISVAIILCAAIGYLIFKFCCRRSSQNSKEFN